MLQVRNGGDGAKAQKPTLVGGAYESLKEAIRNNVFPPGYQGSEQEIASQLGMSCTPVHEAIIRLQEEGLVRVLPRRGVVVCAISPDDMREITRSSSPLRAHRPNCWPKDLRTNEARSSRNSPLLMFACSRPLVPTTWLNGPRQTRDFHQLLVERSGNGRLARMFHTIMDQSHRARMLTLQLRPKPTASVREHRAIVDAIHKGDPEAAREGAKRHRVTARDQLLPLLGEFGMKHL